MIAVPSGELYSATALEDWLIQLGCIKLGCPNRFVCVFQAPTGWHFTAPNPAYFYLVPGWSRKKFVRMVKDIMARQLRPREQ